MQHVAVAQDHVGPDLGADVWLTNLTGRYYTHEAVGRHLAVAAWRAFTEEAVPDREIAVCDPFGGDGRLVVWLIEEAHSKGARCSWRVELWDLDESGLRVAEQTFESLAARIGRPISVKVRVQDSFSYGAGLAPEFDVVLTNPPWENLKPDSRELASLPVDARSRYVSALKETDIALSLSYPLSQPKRKFAGWGTNLARVGVELAFRIAHAGGVVGVVSPASFFADDMSLSLRRWVLSESELLDLAYFPAEARLFGRADLPVAAFVSRRAWSSQSRPYLTLYGHELSVRSRGELHITREFLETWGYLVPISLGHEAVDVFQVFADLPTFGALESKRADGLWAGRELDETNVARFLTSSEDGTFVKGRMVDRFKIRDRPTTVVSKSGWEPPPSVGHERLAWRDVSRPNQKRRVQACIIPSGWIAGNSLGVAYFRDGDRSRLRALLGLVSSLPFEFQLRSLLATGHVTLSALRRVRLPRLDHKAESMPALVEAVNRALVGGDESDVEAAAARLYGLDPQAISGIMQFFPKLTEEEQSDVIGAMGRLGNS